VQDYTVQTHAKAYPTIRELMLASMMGPQGIVSSLCPIHTDEATPGDPLYGYRPAMDAIVNRLKSALDGPCIPQLTPGVNGAVKCQLLVSFPASIVPAGTSCDALPGLSGYVAVDPPVLATFDADVPSLAGQTTCEFNQIPVQSGTTCAGSSLPGWCYVTGAGIGGGSTCTQQIAYSSPSLVPNGASVTLYCQ
jgi:hypothetical protein